ncbi:hypothetical protein LIER_17002 [Lithospermum erythrorhizon]|uniref:GIR1-like zinc ribbon domain-containing protein n=1 Tax=Lithospermum erythrorhizon TaxID=34254 RepID=A0AAV3QE47_LITER
MSKDTPENTSVSFYTHEDVYVTILGHRIKVTKSEYYLRDIDTHFHEDEGDSLIVHGCHKCIMFVMVSKNNPICPNCGKSSGLFNPAKQSTRGG